MRKIEIFEAFDGSTYGDKECCRQYEIHLTKNKDFIEEIRENLLNKLRESGCILKEGLSDFDIFKCGSDVDFVFTVFPKTESDIYTINHFIDTFPTDQSLKDGRYLSEKDIKKILLLRVVKNLEECCYIDHMDSILIDLVGSELGRTISEYLVSLIKLNT